MDDSDARMARYGTDFSDFPGKSYRKGTGLSDFENLPDLPNRIVDRRGAARMMVHPTNRQRILIGAPLKSLGKKADNVVIVIPSKPRPRDVSHDPIAVGDVRDFRGHA
jgi:hypothetical protein